VITQTMQQYGVRPDMVVAFFEAVSAVLICVSVVKLHKDKKVRGVSAWPVTFFALWGWWNIYWYSFIDAPYAWWAGLGVVAANTTWAVQMIYWVWRERLLGPWEKPKPAACRHDRVKVDKGNIICRDCDTVVA
jgi:hypothetical protein